eukprot:3908182-Rhodomonas_salina.8
MPGIDSAYGATRARGEHASDAQGLVAGMRLSVPGMLSAYARAIQRPVLTSRMEPSAYARAA